MSVCCLTLDWPLLFSPFQRTDTPTQIHTKLQAQTQKYNLYAEAQMQLNTQTETPPHTSTHTHTHIQRGQTAGCRALPDDRVLRGSGCDLGCPCVCLTPAGHPLEGSTTDAGFCWEPRVRSCTHTHSHALATWVNKAQRHTKSCSVVYIFQCNVDAVGGHIQHTNILCVYLPVPVWWRVTASGKRETVCVILRETNLIKLMSLKLKNGKFWIHWPLSLGHELWIRANKHTYN